MNHQKKKVIITTLIYVVMMISAMTEGLINIFSVPLRNGFEVNNTTFSLMFTFGSIAYLLGNYIGGYLSEKIGQKNLFVIGLLGAVVANIIQSYSKNFTMFMIGFVLIQGFIGLISIAANTIIPVIWLTGQAIAMNLTHFAYGFGLSASQKISGILITNGISWRKIYIGSAIITFIVFILFLFVKLPRKDVEGNVEKPSLKTVLSDKESWFFILALGFYVVAEQGTGRWLPSYINSNYSTLTESKIASYVSLFFLIFTIGRLVGGFIVQRVGEIRSVRIFSITGFILFIIGLNLGEKGLYIISFSGFFFSIIFPTIVLIVSNIFKKNTAYATGVIITFANIVNTLMNLVVGTTSDNFGISVAIYIMPISICITFIFISLAKREIKNKEN